MAQIPSKNINKVKLTKKLPPYREEIRKGGWGRC
jgi:hypothetical protein